MLENQVFFILDGIRIDKIIILSSYVVSFQVFYEICIMRFKYKFKNIGKFVEICYKFFYLKNCYIFMIYFNFSGVKLILILECFFCMLIYVIVDIYNQIMV